MIKKRIIQILEFKGIAKENFYKKIGMTSASFRGKASETPINSIAIENILSEVPDINPEWLLTGRGEMLKTNLMAEANNKVSEPERKPPDDKDQMIIELQQHRIVSLEKDLKQREREIDQLKKELKTAYDRSVVR